MGTFAGFLAYSTSTQTVHDRQMEPIRLPTNDFDTESMHYTSASALTGTVAKTATSTTLTGSGSAFDTELSAGQVVAIQKTLSGTVVITNGSTTVVGTSTAFTSEVAVGQMLNVGSTTANVMWVSAVTNDTHLTVDHAPQNLSPSPSAASTAYATEHVAISSVGSATNATLFSAAQTSASGITASRVSYAAAVKTAGYWSFYVFTTVTDQPDQDAPATFLVNGLAVRGAANIVWASQANGVPPTGEVFLFPRHFAAGDIVIPIMYWDNDGNSPTTTTLGGSTAYTSSVFGGYLVGT